MRHVKNSFLITILVVFSLTITGCFGGSGGGSKVSNGVYDFSGKPRVRMGAYPSASAGTNFYGPKLGNHGYGYSLSESNGMVYTCRAGHIDVIHVRIAADWTAYLASKTFKCLTTDKDKFSYGLTADRSNYIAKIEYPENWKNLSLEEKQKIAQEVSPLVGQYLTFTTTTWHEILTWFGFKCLVFLPEFPSAFSWEENFSNLLGTMIALDAMKDTTHTYDEAVTIAISNHLQNLGVQSAQVARDAAERQRGKWYGGGIQFAVNMKRRNFDIGLKDGFITPTLCPDVAECAGTEPVSYPAPNLDFLEKYNLKITMVISPHEWEANKIRKIVYGKNTQHEIYPHQFGAIMSFIEKQAVEKYNYICDVN